MLILTRVCVTARYATLEVPAHVHRGVYPKSSVFGRSSNTRSRCFDISEATRAYNWSEILPTVCQAVVRKRIHHIPLIMVT